jgi:hypothetical protein
MVKAAFVEQSGRRREEQTDRFECWAVPDKMAVVVMTDIAKCPKSRHLLVFVR